jgi:4-hydroxybenzoate polyprenyltransferase
MHTVKSYLSLIKFSHTVFAMPFAMVGFCLAANERITIGLAGLFKDFLPSSWNNANEKKPLLLLLLLIVLCMIFARSAAMAFNRYLDRSFDAKNPRTSIREIPAGILKANNVLLFTIASAVLFIICTFFINRLCFFLSPVALLVILGYSYTKRFTALCHLVLGLGLSLAPIGAYIAVTGRFDILPILFSMTVLFWVSGFDIIYALQDEEFDKAHQLHSIPSALGKFGALQVSRILHFLSAVCVLAAGFYGNFGAWYWIGAAVFIGMLLYQHSIVKPTDLSRVNLAFMTANGIASVVFGLFVITDLFIH